MGNRRIGRKRLFALNKAGQSLAKTNGAGAQVVTHQNVRRELDRECLDLCVRKCEQHDRGVQGHRVRGRHPHVLRRSLGRVDYEQDG